MTREDIQQAKFSNDSIDVSIKRVIEWADRNYEKFTNGTMEIVDTKGRAHTIPLKGTTISQDDRGTRVILANGWTHMVPNSYQEMHLAIYGQPSAREAS